MRRGMVSLVALAAAAALCLAPAAGATGSRGSHGRVLVVDKDAHRRTCYGKHHRVFPTIQLAVEAARSGDTIKVCPGLYKETVTVDKPDLTILGANAGRDATRDHRGRESIVEGTPGTGALGVVQLLEDDITWDGFTVRGVFAAKENSPGMYTSPAHSGYLIRDTIFLDNGSGIRLGASGDHPTLVCRNRFTANNEFEGPTGGFGIYSDEGAQQVLITSNLFERHNGAAILFADKGRPQRNVRIEHNKSVDDRAFASIFNSARFRLTSNSIRARLLLPNSVQEPASAIFIGARNDGIVVQKNKIKSASGNGIDITNTGEPGTDPSAPRNVVVRKNKVEHVQASGIAVSATGVRQYQVLHNRSRDNGEFGIHFASGTNGGTVTGNTALGNEVDCKDDSTGPLNIWTANTGVSSQPAALCSAPSIDDNPVQDGRHHDKKKSRKHHKKTKKQKQHRPDPCACAYHPRSM